MVYEHEVSYSILRVQAFEIAEGKSSYRAEYEKSGDNSKEDTPVPIPNTEVKLLSAEGTWRAASRENMTMPVITKENPLMTLCIMGSLFCSS